MTMKHMHVIHMLICFIYKKRLESGILVCGVLTVWEDTDGCAKQYRCDLDIYLITVLSSSYGIITDRIINSPGHGNNVVYGLNATEFFYFKEQIELIGK